MATLHDTMADYISLYGCSLVLASFDTTELDAELRARHAREGEVVQIVPLAEFEKKNQARKAA